MEAVKSMMGKIHIQTYRNSLSIGGRRKALI
jgi:hypothetical protein